MFQPLNNLSFVNCNTLVLRYFYLWINLHDRPFVAKLSVWPIFHKITGYITEQMPEMEKACRKYQNCQVWGPCQERLRFYDGLNFLKNKKICIEKVVGEKGLALQQHFPYKSSKFFWKFKLSYKLLILFNPMPGASNLAALLFLICSF